MPNKKSEKKSHIFISYRSIESEFSLKLAADLRNAGVLIWIDRLDGILGGDDWRRQIEDGLRNAAALIAILSPEYITSQYCLRELATADELNIPILPIILQDIPKDRYPIEIRRLQYINFQDWRATAFYTQQFSQLVSIIKKKVSSKISNIPDAVTRYLNTLIADLESRRGVLEYVELAAQATTLDSRPEPYRNADDEFGFSELIQSSEKPNKRKLIALGNIRDALKKYKSFALIGDPGSSKTTTIRKLALDFARSHLANPKAPLPLLLYLPRWKDNTPIQDFIRSEWGKLGLPMHIDPIPLLRTGDVLLYMDGLNEMGANGITNAKNLYSWLASDDAPCNIIITCRKDDYIGSFDLGLPVVQIELMNDTHIQQFVESYLGEKAPSLLKRILPINETKKHDSRNLHSLARNPYMLSALIVVFEASPNQELPWHNGKLFQMLVRALAKRELNRKSEAWLKFENEFSKVEEALAKLAFTMINTETGTEITLAYASRYLDEDIIRAAQNANYAEVNNGNFRFYHQLIQEYFAAVELGKVGVKSVLQPTEYEDSGKIFFSNPVEKKWDQVVLSLADIERNDKIIKEIMDIDPVLAADYVGSGVSISEQLIDSIMFHHLNRLGEEFVTRKNGAAIALKNLGKIASPHLINILDKDENSYARAGSAYVLGEINEIKAVPALISRLTDTGEAWWFGMMVCDYAKNALKSIGTPEAEEAVNKWAELLLPQLSSDDVHVRCSVAYKLGQIGNPIAVPILINLLSDSAETKNFVDNRRVCDDVAEALQEIGTDEAISAVENWKKQQE